MSVKDTRDRASKARSTPDAGCGRPFTDKGGTGMNSIFLRLHVRLHELTSDEQGQDMVEYALLVSLIALLCVAGISHVAASVNGAFSNISTSLA